MLTLSLIIPAYNEECHIRKCLEAVSRQTVMPDEVILVDNRCTDNTVKIAKEFKFVKVLREENQGLIPARNAGFNKAKGDILGRIDADSVIREDWVENVLKEFKQNKKLSGLTGFGATDFIPYVSRYKSTFVSRVYFWLVHGYFNTITLWGANMAITKKAWKDVESDVCLDDSKVHEDQDISICLAAKGHVLKESEAVRMSSSGQSYAYLPKYLSYTLKRYTTRDLHRRNGNMSSRKMIKIGYWRTRPGRIFAELLLTIGLGMMIVKLPIDYVLNRYGKLPR